METLLEVPFYYTKTGSPPRSRAVETESLIGITPVLVRHVEAAAAPVAAVCRYTTRCFTKTAAGVGTEPCVGEVDYRVLDGKLMRRAVFDTDMFLAGEDAPAYLRSLETFVGNPGGMPAPWDYRESGVFTPDITSETAQKAMNAYAVTCAVGNLSLAVRLPGDGGPVRSSRAENRSELTRGVTHDRAVRAAETAKAMSDGAAFVDGVLYLPSLGPAWKTGMSNDGTLSVRAEPELLHLSGNYYSDMFPFADDASARAYAAASAPGLVAVLTGSISNVRADLLPWHPDEMMVRGLCAEFAETMASVETRKFRPAALRALADIVETLADPSADSTRMLNQLSVLAAERAVQEQRANPGLNWMDQTLADSRLKIGIREQSRSGPRPGT